MKRDGRNTLFLKDPFIQNPISSYSAVRAGTFIISILTASQLLTRLQNQSGSNRDPFALNNIIHAERPQAYSHKDLGSVWVTSTHR